MQRLMIDYILENDHRWSEQELKFLADSSLLQVYNATRDKQRGVS